MSNSSTRAISWRIVPCLFAIIVDYMGFGLIYPLITEVFTESPNVVFPMIQGEEAKDFFMGLAYILYPLFMFFGASLLGDLSDVYGRKKVLVVSVLGIFVSLLAMGVGVAVHSLTLFLIGRAFSGLMAGSQSLCMAAIADLSTEATKPRNMAYVTLTNCLGNTFGPFLGGVLTQKYFLQTIGFSTPLWGASLIALVGAFLLIFFFHETFHLREKRTISMARPLYIFVDALRNTKVRTLIAAIFFQMFGFMLYFQTSGIYLREVFQYSSGELGFFFAYMGVFSMLGVLVVIPIALKKWSIKQIAPAAFLLNGIAEFSSVFYQNNFYVLALTIPFAIFNAVGFTAFVTIASNSTDEKRQGWVMGVVAAAIALSYVASGLATNLLPWLTIRGVILVGGASAILSGLLMARYGRVAQE